MSLPVNALGVVTFFCSLFLLDKYLPDTNNVLATAIAMLAAALPIAVHDLFIVKRFLAPSAGMDEEGGSVNFKRIAVKVIGLFGTYTLVAFFYWLIPEYGEWYSRFFTLLLYAMPATLFLSLIYVVNVDPKMKKPEDGYFAMGMVILGKWARVNRTQLAEHLRRWMVKAFFLPLMFTFLCNDINYLLNYDYANLTVSFTSFYDYALTSLYTVDVIFAAMGYIVTIRLTDSHIRSVEPTMLGWMVCLVCYPPFWSGLFSGRFFRYDDGSFWGNWLAGYDTLYIVWGLAILATLVIYSLSTVCFGFRFSNLTYRGLISSGPYRFCKHPAYIAKNLSWWMISMPFLSYQGWDKALSMSILLLGVNTIYYLRARTEENHLSRYPEYVEYANWMNEHGIFSFIGRWIPYFRYSEERAKSWSRLNV